MKSLSELSPYEKELYTYIVDFIDEHHYPPSMREMADNTSKSSLSTVKRYLERLKDLGLITYHYDESRTIVLQTHNYQLDEKQEYKTDQA